MQIAAKLEGGEALQAALSKHAKQIPFATALALTWTAGGAKKATELDMRANFDQPTPWVMKGIFTVIAKPDKLVAEVKVKDIPENFAGRSMAEIIGQQFAGGSGRTRGRMEHAFTREGFITAGEYLVPGPDAKRDRYGNLSTGQINQIYAALRLFRDPYQNATGSKRSRKNASAAGRLFWSHGKGHSSGLRRGLWSSTGKGGPKLVLVVVPKVAYKQRIDLLAIANRVVARDYRSNFAKAMAYAIRTAK